MLPARFDDTEIPGLSSTIAYVDLKEKTPYELCLLIGEKLAKPIEPINQQGKSLREAVDRIIVEEEALSHQNYKLQLKRNPSGKIYTPAAGNTMASFIKPDRAVFICGFGHCNLELRPLPFF